eukprot:7787592-Pyramimonas_sp.AAC.1
MVECQLYSVGSSPTQRAYISAVLGVVRAGEQRLADGAGPAVQQSVGGERRRPCAPAHRQQHHHQ